MFTLKSLSHAALLLVLLMSVTFAQEGKPTGPAHNAQQVIASASSDRVRLAAPSSIVQLRLEVYDALGRKHFDNELRGGNVLDWYLRDGQAEPLSDGAYLCLITVKHLSGKLTQILASVTVDKSIASVHATTALQMTPQQAEVIGPVEGVAALTVMKGDEQPASTVLAHTGEEGQLTRSKGPLSFRLGDFYSGSDVEQMRLTAEGNLGIGTAQPQTRLDVDGLIRTNHGIVFPDGSVQFSASRKTYGPTSLGPGQYQKKALPGQEHLSPDASGTGTTGRISKWQDGPNGILNDANITETSGAIGINGTPNTSFRLDVNGIIRVMTLGAGGATSLCRNASNQISTCSSSLRYKAEVQPLRSGLAVIERLRPITFTWKQSGERDLGLAAERVFEVEPLLATHNSQGEIEGVKYAQLGVVLINAVQQQQTQIKQQQRLIDSLMKVVCADHPKAQVCQSKRRTR